jgi:hypothetical protein
VSEVDGEYNVTDVKARLGDPGAPGHLVVTDATASFGYDRPIALRATGQYNDHSFSTAGLWPVELTTRFGKTDLNIEGSLTQPLSVQAYDLQIKIGGPGVTDLEKLARRSFPSLGPYSLGGQVRVRDGDYAISALQGFIDSADAATRLRDAPFTLAFEGGRLADLFAPTKPWPVKLTANTLGSVAEIRGTLARPLEGKGMNLRVKASGPRMYPLGRLIGRPVPSFGSYALSGRVADSETGYRVTDVKIRISAGELRGNVAFELREQRPYLRIQITSDALDLNKALEAEADAVTPVALDPLGAPFALPLLRTVDADVSVRIKRITRRQVEVGDYTVTSQLRNGRFVARRAGGSTLTDGRAVGEQSRCREDLERTDEHRQPAGHCRGREC